MNTEPAITQEASHVLTDMQNHYFTEAMNISIGKAASSLSEIVGDSVTLSVPVITFLTQNDASKIHPHPDLKQHKLTGVSQHFSGCFGGEALLLFPEEDSRKIVMMMLGNTIPVDAITELEQEALSEIGNIIINGILGCLANLFKKTLDSELPEYIEANNYNSIINSLSNSDDDSEHMIMLLQVKFALESQAIDGYLSIVLDFNSLRDLITSIDEQLAGL